MKKLFTLILILHSVMIQGQITLTYSDFESAFAIGAVYHTYSTPMGSDYEVFVGEPSSNAQIWDMTAIPFEYVAISSSVEPSSTPFHNSFPNANLVLYERYWFGPGDSLYTWNYKELQGDRLMLHAQTDETSIALSWDPPIIQSVIPMTLGTTWMSDRDSTYYMPQVYVISENVRTADAFGTLKLSSGEFQCLRVRLDHLSISHTPAGIDTTRTRSFVFYTKDMVELYTGTILEDQFDLTTIWTSGLKISGRPGTVGLPDADIASLPMMTRFFPDPANGVVDIHYSLKRDAVVSISLADLSGKEVMVCARGRLSAGDYQTVLSLSGIPSGVYLCSLRANDRTETRKLVLVR